MSKFKHFSTCKTLQELKNKYRELVFANHPDRGGDHKKMVEINLEYELAFAYIKEHPQNVQDKEGNIHDGFLDIINKIIHLPEINIEICGNWLWITGNTYPVRQQLKEAGFFWRSNKKAWSWNPPEYKSSRHKSWEMDKIRGIYGSQAIASQEREKLAM